MGDDAGFSYLYDRLRGWVRLIDLSSFVTLQPVSDADGKLLELKFRIRQHSSKHDEKVNTDVEAGDSNQAPTHQILALGIVYEVRESEEVDACS